MEELTDKQLKFIDAYIKSKNMTETCKTLKISRETAYRYIKDENIKAEIDKRRREMISDASLFLQDSLNECSKVLMDIIKDKETTAQVKINAINSIFSNCNKLTETNDVLTKIAEIEQKLAEQEQDS